MTVGVYLSVVMSDGADPARVAALVAALEKAGYTVVNPLAAPGFSPAAEQELFWRVRELRGMLHEDRRRLLRCAAVVLVYEDGKQAWGSGMEVGWAFENGIPVVLTYRDGVRCTASESVLAVAEAVCQDHRLTATLRALS